METRFNRHADRLLERHGCRVWRLGLDAGFACPHREGGRGRGGCDFCSPDAGLAAYQKGAGSPAATVEEQIARAVAFARQRYGAEAFFLYFQAYSCTNLPVDELSARYDEAMRILELLMPGSLRGLVVSTRPDCFDSDKAALLAGYVDRGLEVWVEFGLQSSSDETLERVNRGHTSRDFTVAMQAARGRGLRSAAHLILGLPGESREDMLASVSFAANRGIDGVKFHDLRLARGSALERSFPSGEFAPLHPSRLSGLLADCLERLPEHVEILRLCADFGKGETLDLFPRPDKSIIYKEVDRILAARGSRQGFLCR